MKFRFRRTGGGVVVNARGEVLLLERDVMRRAKLRHEVRLPKGRIEAGETAEEAALRETCEESGFCDLEVVASLGSRLSFFRRRRTWTLRREHYFLMRLRSEVNRGATPHSPASEEALFRSLWAATWDEAEQRLTYDSEKLFIRRARKQQGRLKIGD